MANFEIPLIPGVKDKVVFVGLSGGVDSAVSAAILQKSGAKVVAVFMKNWAGEAGLQLDCPWEEDQRAAREVAEYLGIEFMSYNFEREYKEKVLDYFLQEYSRGRTPNPDILCNSEIKFKAFLDKATSAGAEFVATGHYSGVATREVSLPSVVVRSKVLIKSPDPKKDQSYFLSALSLQQLSRSIFPLYGFHKDEVRKLALSLGLPNALRKDSQGICFIGDLDVSEFLRKYISKNPGSIIDVDSGQIIGKHEGLGFYTIGQREGLGIGGSTEPLYVVSKNLDTNALLVAKGRDNPALYKDRVNFSNIYWHMPEFNSLSLAELNSLGLKASIRYHHPEQPGVFLENAFVFSQPQRAITPGQSLVFYLNDICLGRAIIED